MNIRNVITRLNSFSKRHPYSIYILVALVYVFFAFYYMGPSLINCGGSVYGFGDSTAGPIWKFSLGNQSPIGNYQNMSNYPFGENLGSPVGYSLIIQSTLLWVLSNIFGPICGYSIMNALGFVLTALVMFGFIHWLTKNKWIAWLAGFAVSFTPYFQIKVGIHPGYGFGALLIGVLWLFLLLVQHPSLKRAIGLGVVTITSLYFDPYFTLLIGTILLSLGLTWFVWRSRSALLSRLSSKIATNYTINQTRYLAIAATIVVIGLLPLVYVKAHYSRQISSVVSSSRGDVAQAAKLCSAYPYEYLLPYPLHPAFNMILSPQKLSVVRGILYDKANCGLSEDAIGLSLTVVVVIVLGLVVLVREKLNNRKIKLLSGHKNDLYIVATIVLVGLGGFLVALPPTRILGVPTLSLILLHFTNTWRVIEREYLVVNICIITLFATIMAFFAQKPSTRKKLLMVAFIVIFCGILFEYQITAPFEGNAKNQFRYADTPKAYYWLGGQQDIKAIAEYPMEKMGIESDSTNYYLTMQHIHHKPLVNSTISNSPQEAIRSSIKNLKDPQTIPVLSSMGVDAIVVHGVSPEELNTIPYLNIVYVGNHSPFGRFPPSPIIKKDYIVVASIEGAPKIQEMIQFKNTSPYNGNIITSAIDWRYEITQDFLLGPAVIRNDDALVSPMNVCFDIRLSVPGSRGSLTILNDNKTVKSLEITGDIYTPVELLDVNTVLRLHNDTGANMRITKVGCLFLAK